MAYQFNGFRATKPVVRLIDSNGNYEVFFVVYDASETKHQFRYKKGINSEPQSRKQRATELALLMWEALEGGWNPLHQKYPKLGVPPTADESSTQLNLDDGLQFALTRKKAILSKFSLYDYEGTVRFITAAAKITGHRLKFVGDIKRRDIRMIMAQAVITNKWSANARNKYLSLFRALLSVLVDEDLLEHNPAFGIKEDPVEHSMGYRRLTDDERDQVAGHLLKVAPDYFEYLMFIYQDGIRRKETLMLKVKDVNILREEIRIRAEVAKTNTERIVPLTPVLKEIVMRRKIWELKPDDYLFSEKFLPGAQPLHVNTPTNWWRKLVITQLGIDCKMYSLKHRGADDRIEQGTALEVLKKLYGHKSLLMTEVYAAAIRDKYKQQLIDNSPVFGKVG